jgi:two-component system sensor histidine kinase BaeS
MSGGEAPKRQGPPRRDGPPWGGADGPGPEDWGAYRREMWRRRGGWGYGPPWRRRRPGPFARGFGCLAGLVFLLVIASLLAAATSFIEQFGPLPALIAIAAVVGLLGLTGTRLRRAARSLDRIVDAAARVEEGDYSVRVGEPESPMPPIRSLAGAFDTMVDRLERDEDQRRTLLNDVSHELRTPLSVIAGNLEAMIDGVHPADEAHLTAILEQAGVMERLIDDLRTVALSEAGTLPLHREPTDPDVLIDEVVRSFAGAGTGADGTAEVSVAADVPSDLPIIDVDPVRLREVLANLVGNAVRHTPAGGTVVVRARVLDDRLEIRVIDSGPGIDADLLPHVFDRFVKGTGSTGSGLGLAIARYLVAAHDGTLEVEATGSAGTTFLVTLPV